MEKLKIALLLGGGGARGLAHIGVIKALEKNNIPIDIIVGTSMGALVGAVYAQHPNAKNLEGRFTSFLNGDLFQSIGISRFDKEQSEPDNLLGQLTRELKRRVVINIAANRKSLFKNHRLKIAINNLVDDGLIEDTKLPFICSALDLTKMEEVIFDQGSIQTAVSASSSIPGFLPPVEINGSQYVDGSICTNFPWEYAKKIGADILIAVDVTFKNVQAIKPDNVIDIVMRTNISANHKINRLALENVDYIIRPPLGEIYWNEFNLFKSVIESGYYETKKVINDIKEIIRYNEKLSTRIKKRILNKISV